MIRITDKYMIFVDDMNYTVAVDKHKMRTDKKTGKTEPIYAPLAYVSSLDSAIETVARKITMDVLAVDTEMTLQEAILVVRDIYQAFIDTIKEAIPEDLRKRK